MKYSLDVSQEAKRLEQQVFSKNYLLSEEIGRFAFKSGEKILDAGCGSGVLSRYLMENFHPKHVDGIDSSDIRVKQATDLCKQSGLRNIEFARQDLHALDSRFHNQYDTVICRYVVEHVEHPLQVMKELRKTLKKNGRLIVIDLDGVFINLFHQNTKLAAYLAEFKSKVRFDLEVGRKLPLYYKQAGFTNLQWEVETLCCKDERHKEEYANTEMRFSGLVGFLSDLFGSTARFEEFRQLYLDEMAKPENTLVFNKYICVGTNS